MTVRIPPLSAGESSKVYTIDFRETAPALANKTMYKDNPKAAQIGGLAVGVPGEILGLQEAHSRWGSLPWEELVQPSVDIAQGWRVDVELAKRMRVCSFQPVEGSGAHFGCSGIQSSCSRIPIGVPFSLLMGSF